MPDDSDWTAPGDQPADPAPPESWPRAATPAPPPAWGQPPAQPQWGQPQPQWGQPQPPGWGQPSPPQWGQPAGQAGYGGWTGMPPAAHPGVIPLRPLGVGELLDGAITTIRRYPRATLGLSAAVVTVTQVLQFLATKNFSDSLSDGSFDGTGIFGVLLGVLFGMVTGVLLSGALTVVMGQAVLGRPISLDEAWRAVRARFWALIGASLLVSVLTVIGFVLCIAPGVYAAVALSLATPALMLERQPVSAALRRSRDLVKGQFWRCCGVLILAAIISSFVSGALSLPFILAGGGFGSVFTGTADTTGDVSSAQLALSTIGGIIAGTITAPFSAGVSALLYVDRRMRAEGLDVTLAAAAATQALPPAAPPMA